MVRGLPRLTLAYDESSDARIHRTESEFVIILVVSSLLRLLCCAFDPIRIRELTRRWRSVKPRATEARSLRRNRLVFRLVDLDAGVNLDGETNDCWQASAGVLSQIQYKTTDPS